jgi:hypothetical protein
MDYFRGMYHTTILCHHCQTASHSFDVFLALSLPVPFVVYPTLTFHYVRNKARITNKYEICLKGLNNFNDIFKVFKAEVLTHRPAAKVNEKMEKESSESPHKNMNYLLLRFHRTKDSVELWNHGFKNALSDVEITIEQLT